jgi:hypothetical protein
LGGSAIRALVSGYPRRLWSEKLLVMLQAFIDDSESSIANRRLVLAAYVHAADAWMDFSDAWEAALHEEPRIEYFKMVEAQNRRDQFQGWSEKKRTKKVYRLAQVIAAFEPLSVDCYLNAKYHRKVLKPYAPYGLSSAYYPLVFALTCGVARVCHILGAHLPCDFIFDKQDNVSKHVLQFWDYTVDQQPREWGQFINRSPIFRDDKEKGFVALQAADMLAWHTRRWHDGSYPAEYEGLRELIRRDGFSYSIEITDDMLDSWAEGMQKIPGSKSVLSKKDWNTAMARIVAEGFPSSAEQRAEIQRLTDASRR